MKKFLKFIPLVLVALFATTLWSCSKDDDGGPAPLTELPATAKTFLSTYYPSVEYKAYKDDNGYDVVLSNGQKVDFDSKGEWYEVEATIPGQTIPTGFYPAAIDTYVSENYSGAGIREISKEVYGFDVELVQNIDLKFDTAGNFISVDL